MSKSKKQDVRFVHVEETGETICYLLAYINGQYQMCIGSTYCHEEDKEFSSNLVGEHIAYQRAFIKVCKLVKLDLLSRQAAMNELYYAINKSKHFNKKSYEAKMIFRKINQYKTTISQLTDLIKNTQDELKEYIDEKTNQHRLLKKIRAKTQSIEDKDKTV